MDKYIKIYLYRHIYIPLTCVIVIYILYQLFKPQYVIYVHNKNINDAVDYILITSDYYMCMTNWSLNRDGPYPYNEIMDYLNWELIVPPTNGYSIAEKIIKRIGHFEHLKLGDYEYYRSIARSVVYKILDEKYNIYLKYNFKGYVPSHKRSYEAPILFSKINIPFSYRSIYDIEIDGFYTDGERLSSDLAKKKIIKTYESFQLVMEKLTQNFEITFDGPKCIKFNK